jgi:putative ABC transport system ATP-binding protein
VLGDETVIRLQDLHKTYKLGDIEVHALRGINLTIRRGEFVAIMGASGSGKSTVMNIIGCLDRPTAGAYLLEGEDVSALSADQWALIRNGKIGFVFQGFNLDNSKGSRSHARLSIIRPCCSQTSPPAIWTPRPARRSWSCFRI